MIELAVHGSSQACRAAARTGREAADALEGQVRTVRRVTCDAWEGDAADDFRDVVPKAASAMADLAERLSGASRALEELAGELEVVTARMDEVRSRASGAGLVISGDAVLPPAGAGTLMTEDQFALQKAQVDAYNQVFDLAKDTRLKEREAHARVVEAMRRSNGDGLVEDLLERLGIAAPDVLDGVSGSGYVAGLAGLGFGTYVGWKTDVQMGGLVDRPGVLRDLGVPAGGNPVSRWLHAHRPRPAEWEFTRFDRLRVPRERWETRAKWANRAGGVVTGLTSAWEQWGADADDPSLDTGERVDRTVTKGTLAGGGALAGASVGASWGATLGTFIMPGPGTVIGGAIGGLVGGATGAFSGSLVADEINKRWDGIGHGFGAVTDEVAGEVADIGERVGEELSNAGEIAGRGLSAAGDALSFWD